MSTEPRPKVLVIGTDRYCVDACVRFDIDATFLVGAETWDDGLIEVPERFRVLPVDDQASAEGILAALHRAGLGDVTWDAVHTGDEYALVAVSLLAQHLGCRTIGPVTAMHFRDKAVQKRTVAAAGLRAARTTVIEDIFDVSGIEELPYPCAVLKPVAGAATTMTTVVGSVEELRARSREYAAERIRERIFLLEEFVGGDEWLVDGVLFDGQLLFCGVATYAVPCLTTVRDNLPVSMRRFDPETDKWAYDKAVPFTRTALAALGLRYGVFHLELFHDAQTGELTFGECAARRGGGMIHEEVQAKFNVHLGECALLGSLGRRPEINVKLRPEAIGTGYLPGKPGTLLDCPTSAQLLELPGVEFARVESPRGTRFAGRAASTDQRLGQVLIAAETPDQLDSRFAEVRAWFAERVVTVPDGVRARELRSWQREIWPHKDFGDTLWR